jgi:hypothetical protein
MKFNCEIYHIFIQWENWDGGPAVEGKSSSGLLHLCTLKF